MAIKITTYQESDGNWRANIDDAEGNTLATLPNLQAYGTYTEQGARTLAERFVERKEQRGIDIEGGGFKA